MAVVLRNNQAALFSAITDMRYDLQDGEESQREGLRARNEMFMPVCVCVCAHIHSQSHSLRGFVLFSPQTENQWILLQVLCFTAGLSNTQSSSIKWLESALWTQPLAEFPFTQKCKVPVRSGAPCSGCPHKKTYSWLQQLGEKPIDGPTSLDQHYFLLASLFGEAFFCQGSYCSARLPIEKTTNPSTTHPPTRHHLTTTTERGTPSPGRRHHLKAFCFLVFSNQLVTASISGRLHLF